MQEIIISLTTISKRINNIHLTIQSLIEQECSFNFSIRLYISKDPYLLDEGIPTIPKSIINIQKLISFFTIHYTENIGSYRKLVPLLIEKKHTDCLIITVDDDKIYHKNFLKRLINAYYKYDKKYIIAHRAFIRVNPYLLNIIGQSKNKCITNILNKFIKNKKKNIHSQNILFKYRDKFDILNKLSFFEGNDGVLYHPSFFSPLTTNTNLIKKIGAHHDDFWFKLNTLYNNIGVICINPFQQRSSKQIDNTQHYGLHENLNKGSYEIELNNMCEWFNECIKVI